MVMNEGVDQEGNLSGFDERKEVLGIRRVYGGSVRERDRHLLQTTEKNTSPTTLSDPE